MCWGVKRMNPEMFRGVDLLGDKRDYLDIIKEIQQLDKQIGSLAGRRAPFYKGR
jgi:hypothetical protein